MDRGRERRHDGDRPLGGESYRPSERNAPPRSNYRGYRSPPRRGRTPLSYTDTYAPSADRRRSRSPAFGSRGGYRGRLERSPPRNYSPRRDVRARTPPSRPRRYSRSPVRPRSPIPLKRDAFPHDDRRRRSPIPIRRGSPPRERYEKTVYTPPRTIHRSFPEENNYRPGERARSPPLRRVELVSHTDSPISSRRSSPPIHPDRLANTTSLPHSPAYRNSRPPPPATRDVDYRDRSPPRRAYSPVPIPAPREPVPYRQRSPPPPLDRERNKYRNGTTPASWSDAQRPIPEGPSYRNGDSRLPLNGPGYSNSFARNASSGPPSSVPISMSAHNRPSGVSNSVLLAPTRPRGGLSFSRGDSRERPYGGPSTHRGGRPPPQSSYPGPPRQSHDSRQPSDYIPHGPRSSQGLSSHDTPRHPPPFRSNNSTSTTYPNSKRFSTNHLASLPSIVPGGKALPSLDPAAEKKLQQLEEDSKKLREAIEEKQREKRKGLMEWETRERESKSAALRSELAETQLDALSGEMTGGTAF